MVKDGPAPSRQDVQVRVLLFLSAQEVKILWKTGWLGLDHDWGPWRTLRLVSDPAIRLGDGGIVTEGVLRVILVLLQAMFSGRITSSRARLAVIADVGLVVGVVGVAVALDGIGASRVVVAGGKVAEVVVGDGLSALSVGSGRAIHVVERRCREGRGAGARVGRI